jgi:hypothetical protein
MMLLTIIFVGLGLLLAYQLSCTRQKPGLYPVPGPFLASISNLWKINAVYRGVMPSRNVEVHQKYGLVIRVGPKHVSFSSLAAIKTIYSSRQHFQKVSTFFLLLPS